MYQEKILIFVISHICYHPLYVLKERSGQGAGKKMTDEVQWEQSFCFNLFKNNKSAWLKPWTVTQFLSDKIRMSRSITENFCTHTGILFLHCRKDFYPCLCSVCASKSMTSCYRQQGWKGVQRCFWFLGHELYVMFSICLVIFVED